MNIHNLGIVQHEIKKRHRYTTEQYMTCLDRNIFKMLFRITLVPNYGFTESSFQQLYFMVLKHLDDHSSVPPMNDTC